MDTRPYVETNVAARLDRLPWSKWHWLIVTALGITWILDGLEATLGSALGGVLKDPNISLGLSDAQIGLDATFYLVGQVIVRVIGHSVGGHWLPIFYWGTHRPHPDHRLVSHLLCRLGRRELGLSDGKRDFSARNPGIGDRHFLCLWHFGRFFRPFDFRSDCRYRFPTGIIFCLLLRRRVNGGCRGRGSLPQRQSGTTVAGVRGRTVVLESGGLKKCQWSVPVPASREGRTVHWKGAGSHGGHGGFWDRIRKYVLPQLAATCQVNWRLGRLPTSSSIPPKTSVSSVRDPSSVPAISCA
jgi:hypothetical protein